MKKTFLFISLILIVTSSHAQKKTGHDIKITIHGLEDTVCYLAYHYGDKQYMKDTIQLDAKGSGHFQGDKALDGGIYMVVTLDKNFFEIIVDEQFFTIETQYPQLVDNIKFTGSKENKLFQLDRTMLVAKQTEAKKLSNQLDTIQDKNSEHALTIKKFLTQIDEDVKTFRKEIIADHPESFYAKLLKTMSEPEIPEAPMKADGTVDSTFAWRYFKSHYWDDVDFSDDRMLHTPIFHNKLKKYFSQTVPQIVDSINKAADVVIAKSRANKLVFQYTLVYILNEYANSKIMGMDAVYVYIGKNYYCSNDTSLWWIDQKDRDRICPRVNAVEPLLLNKPCPPLILENEKHQWISLYDIKADYTILVFWDPDCGHCKKTIPFVIDAYHKYKSLGVEMIAVNTEVEEDKWMQSIETYGLDCINLADLNLHNNFRSLFDVQQTPVIFILDKEKKIKAKRISGEQVDQVLGDFLEMDGKIIKGQ